MKDTTYLLWSEKYSNLLPFSVGNRKYFEMGVTWLIPVKYISLNCRKVPFFGQKSPNIFHFI